jgi:hypothetical protein
MPDMPRGWFLINLGFMIILSSFTLSLFFCRLKAKYVYREIEDISIFDYSLKQDIDLDSIAILTVYYEELR